MLRWLSTAAIVCAATKAAGQAPDGSGPPAAPPAEAPATPPSATPPSAAAAAAAAAQPAQDDQPSHVRYGDDGELYHPGAQTQRHPGITEVAADLRALVPVAALTTGVLGDLRLTHRFGAPIAVHVEANPIGVGVGSDGPVAPAAANALLSLDTQWFELGAGGGSATLRSRTASAALVSPSLAQLIRLGTLDGVSLVLRSSLLFDSRDKKSPLRVGFVDGTARVPLGERVWMQLRIGGGTVGYWLGELGLRNLLAGDCGKGSLFSTLLLGMNGTFDIDHAPDGSVSSSALYIQVVIGYGLEWRF